MAVSGHVVLAPDKFKGSLTGAEVAAHLAAGLHRFDPAMELRTAPVADGGDGTLEAVTGSGYQLVPVRVAGPTGRPVDAGFARRGTTAVVELAEASGLRRLPAGRLDPMRAGSRGTGELIRAALDAGCRQIVLGVGGSAGTDGGAGLLQALGARLLDSDGAEIAPGGAGLAGLREVRLDRLDQRLRAARLVLACDVDNPLLGPTGAAAVYARQKGAGADQIRELDAGLRHWAELVHRATGADLSSAPGAGAAGGVGFAALAVLGATMAPGIALVLDLIGFDQLLAGAGLVITGEGSLDQQSLHGKAPIGVALAATRAGLTAIAVAGRCNLSPAELAGAGLAAGYPLTSLEPDPRVCIRDAGRLLEQLAATVIGPTWLT